jgi:hypothetical protein
MCGDFGGFAQALTTERSAQVTELPAWLPALANAGSRAKYSIEY